MKTDGFEVTTNVVERLILRHISVASVMLSDVCHSSTSEPYRIHVALQSSKILIWLIIRLFGWLKVCLEKCTRIVATASSHVKCGYTLGR